MAKNNNAYSKVIARAWKDARFKEKLLKNPKEALKEMGMDVPANFDVRVIEEKAGSITFVLPKTPSQARELSEQDLQKLAGGAMMSADPCPSVAKCDGLKAPGISMSPDPRLC